MGAAYFILSAMLPTTDLKRRCASSAGAKPFEPISRSFVGIVEAEQNLQNSKNSLGLQLDARHGTCHGIAVATMGAIAD